MHYKFDSYIEDGHLVIVTSGSVDSIEDYTTLTKQVGVILIKSGTSSALVDVTQVNYPQSILLQSDVVKKYDSLFPQEIKGVRIACLVASNMGPIADFWEHSVKRLGYNMNGFINRNEAMRYLNYSEYNSNN